MSKISLRFNNNVNKVEYCWIYRPDKKKEHVIKGDNPKQQQRK